MSIYKSSPERESDKLIKELLNAKDPNSLLSNTAENAQASRLMAAHAVWDVLRRAGLIDNPTPPMALRSEEQERAETDALETYKPTVLAKLTHRPGNPEANYQHDARQALTGETSRYSVLVKRVFSDGHWSDPHDTMCDTEVTWYGFESAEDAKAFIDKVGTEFEEPSFGGDDPYGYSTSHSAEINPWFVDQMLVELDS